MGNYTSFAERGLLVIITSDRKRSAICNQHDCTEDFLFRGQIFLF